LNERKLYRAKKVTHSQAAQGLFKCAR